MSRQPRRVRRTTHAKRLLAQLEHRWDDGRLRRVAAYPPADFRIVAFLGHGNSGRVLVRGRVLDDPEPGPDLEGESAWSAARRTTARFLTHELPGVPLEVRVGATSAAVTSDAEGYFDVDLPAEDLTSPWTTARVSLAGPYRGLVGPHTTTARVRVPTPSTAVGIISDVDDTILLTGAQRALSMLRQTFTGTALTRTPLPGAAALYRELAAGERQERPFFYVSSSPWNLHDFLVAFLEHRGFPLGPLLLRDLVGDGSARTHLTHKRQRIEEVLALHPDLEFVLVGDSGQHDPEIYADVVRRHPGRVRAIYIREVRLDPGDGRVEAVLDGWDHDVPFVLAEDSATIAQHLHGLGLLDAAAVAAVREAVD